MSYLAGQNHDARQFFVRPEGLVKAVHDKPSVRHIPHSKECRFRAGGGTQRPSNGIGRIIHTKHQVKFLTNRCRAYHSVCDTVAGRESGSTLLD